MIVLVQYMLHYLNGFYVDKLVYSVRFRCCCLLNDGTVRHYLIYNSTIYWL